MNPDIIQALYTINRTIEKDFFDYLLIVVNLVLGGINVVTLFFLYKTYKETKDTRLDNHLPLLICERIYIFEDQNSIIKSLKFILNNKGFDYFNFKHCKLNKKSIKLDFTQEVGQPTNILTNDITLLQTKQNNQLEIFYSDIHGRNLKTITTFNFDTQERNGPQINYLTKIKNKFSYE